jgi:hypothetical protein
MKKVPPKYDVGYKKKTFSFKAILVLKILKSPHTCKLKFISIRGPFFTNCHWWNNLKRFFLAQILPFFSSVLQPSVTASVLKLILLFYQVIVHASAES